MALLASREKSYDYETLVVRQFPVPQCFGGDMFLKGYLSCRTV